MSSSPPPPPTAAVQNWYQSEANGLYALSALAGLTFPGALLGALCSAGLWHISRSPLGQRLLLAGTAAVTAFLTHGVMLGWFWNLSVAAATSHQSPAAPESILRSLSAETLLGPSLLLTLQLANTFRLRTTLGQITREHSRMRTRAKALELGYKQSPTGLISKPAGTHDWSDPPGKIRLGVDDTRRIFDLDLAEIERHVFVPGATGMGKTTTLMRLAGGALTHGFGVVIIDCKGVGMALDARNLAERFHLQINLVDPDDLATLGYNPCEGDPAHIANKLVGAFTFSGNAEIYKQVALEVVPVIARALSLAEKKITLRAIYDALGKGGLHRLGREVPDGHMQDRLNALGNVEGVGAAGYLGLQRRLGALLEGKFGHIFEKRPALIWPVVTGSPSVTYFSLSATATSEDVELFGRVITQDLKQLCDSRLRAVAEGKPLTPLLIIYDEFAALREAPQIINLLLQARQAKMSLVVATQFLPEDTAVRTPVLQAGTLICHQVAAPDADAIAAEFGTRKVPETTAQVDYETGKAPRGSVRTVEAYHIHPDDLKKLPIGYAAVYARASQRRTILHIHKDQ